MGFTEICITEITQLVVSSLVFQGYTRIWIVNTPVRRVVMMHAKMVTEKISGNNYLHYAL